MELTKDARGGEEKMTESETVEEWTEVLLLDHIRSRNRYIGLLEHWSQQLQLGGRLLLGKNILVILQGRRRNIKVLPVIHCKALQAVFFFLSFRQSKCMEEKMNVNSLSLIKK